MASPSTPPLSSDKSPLARYQTPRKRLAFLRPRLLVFLAVVGPGIISQSAGNDAGGVTTYAIAGAQFGYGLLWILILTTISYAVTQEMGARMGIVTGKGLGELIRERYGPRWTLLAVGVLTITNLGDTAADVAGIGAALQLFGVTKYVSIPLAVIGMYLLAVKGNFARIEKIFLLSAALFVAYVISGFMAHPDWGSVFHSVIIPPIQLKQAYIFTFIGVIGTTITPWGQFFIQSYVVDKRLTLPALNLERADVYIGSIISQVIAFFIVVATAATLYIHGQRSITDAADAARALAPLAGSFAAVLFGLGLLNASLLGSMAIPLSGTYTVTQALGTEFGLSHRLRDAPLFYSTFSITVLLVTLFVLIPGMPLITVMFISQVLDGILLPILLLFVVFLANDRSILGKYVNGRIFNIIAWTTIIVLITASLLLVLTTIIQQINGGGP
ncbi:MAG: Nramp family divalent metal transporter [Chloroflexi bacterium]|nr:Nramp family divalent metal transporter [Chloroflexota bacterium]